MSQFVELTREITRSLAALGLGNFTFNGNQDGYTKDPIWTTAQHETGAVVWFHRDRQRIAISGSYPKDSQGHYHEPWPENRQRITVSAARTPASIAADIAKRFWPQYSAAYAVGLESVEASNQRHDEMLQNKKLLIDLVHGRQSHRENEVHGNGWRAELNHTGDGLYRLEFTSYHNTSLDIETAIDLIKLFRRSNR